MDEQFAYEKWWVTVREEDRKLPPECLCPAAWNAAYSLGLAKGRKEGEPRGRGEGIADFICYLIDNHETETITEERLQQIYAGFIKADAIRQAAQGGKDTCDNCGGSLGDDAPLYEDADICRECHDGIEAAQGADRAAGRECCEWIRGAQSELYTICKGQLTFGMLPANGKCPYCGRKIHVKES